MPSFSGCTVERTEEILRVKTSTIELAYHTSQGVYDLRFHQSKGEPLTGIGFAFRYQGRTYTERELRAALAESSVTETEDCFGKGVLATISRAWGDLIVRQSFRLLPEREYLLVSCSIEGFDFVRSNYMAPMACGGKVCQIPDAAQYRVLRAPYDNDMWNRYRACEPQECAGSYEVTAAYDAATRRGYVIGSVSHDHWKIGIDTHGGYEGLSELTVYGGAACADTRDVMPHGMVTGKRVESPWVFCGYYGDFRQGMQEFGRVNAQYQPPLPWDQGVPFGWNSWACAASELNLDIYQNAGETLAGWQEQGFQEDGTAYVNFDACWGKLSQEELETAVRTTHARGQKAGIYFTPFACWTRNFDQAVEYTGGRYTYRDILARDSDGNILPPVDGGYSVDPTHPGNQMRVEGMARFAADMGFDYLKTDFMAHGARECVHYLGDIHTGTEAYHFGLKRLCELLSPEKLGRPFFIDFSIAPVFPHGYAHARRISCDAFGQMMDTEYMLNSLTFGFWQNHTIYRYNDPDHTVLYKSFGRAVTTLAEAQARLYASVISGTVMLLSDDYRIPEARERTRELLTPELLAIAKKGETFLPLETARGDRASRGFIRDDGDVFYLAVFNYDKEPLAYPVDCSSLGELPENPAFEMLDGGRRFTGRRFTISLEPEESLILRCQK